MSLCTYRFLLFNDKCLCCLSVGVPLVGNLRTRLLALHVLEAVLPACEASVENDQITQVLELYAE